MLINRIRKPMMSNLVQTFAALGDPVRFAIAERLLRAGPTHAGALQDVAEISAPAISRHLKVLRAAGVVTQKVEGNRRIYAIAPDAVAQISTWTLDHKAFWGGSLDRLARALEEDET
ncbi:MAG: DNA-binding transcriptional ArsR family regulator [Sulfitobacter sp.]|jgi:DNA-binding transcriptional ArsR family regulator